MWVRFSPTTKYLGIGRIRIIEKFIRNLFSTDLTDFIPKFILCVRFFGYGSILICRKKFSSGLPPIFRRKFGKKLIQRFFLLRVQRFFILCLFFGLLFSLCLLLLLFLVVVLFIFFTEVRSWIRFSGPSGREVGFLSNSLTRGTYSVVRQ